MKKTVIEPVVKIYCDMCGRNLTNKSRSSKDNESKHYCLDSVSPGHWVWNADFKKNVRVPGLPDCSRLAEMGVKRIEMEGELK